MLPLDEVFEFRGQPVLSGLFGVEKSNTLQDGRKTLRLIMNLIPTNSLMTPIVGSVRKLPSITAWLGITTEPGESLGLCMASAFYLFRLPSAWHRYLAFNVKFKGSEIVQDNRVHVLCCNVLPMGWISSVAVMQEVAESVAYLGGAGPETQIARGHILPPYLLSCVQQSCARDRPWWHVYLDNFCVGQRCLPGKGCEAGRTLHEGVEDAWDRSGLVLSKKKRVSDAEAIHELGAWIDGSTQTILISGERFIKLIQCTLYLLSQRFLSKKLVQIVVGRWVHALQYRRPAMGILQEVWQFISSSHPTPKLVMQTRRELWNLILLSPCIHTFLGARIDTATTASDASMRGGAVGMAEQLTVEGRDFVLSSVARSRDASSVPILVVSLFNGFGGCFRIYDILDIRPLGLISVELYAPANRIVEKRWPHVKTVSDVRLVDRQLVRDWLLEFPMAKEIHLWAGFPCVDLSSAKAYRQGLEGPSSSLVHEIPRIEELLRTVFGPTVEVKRTIENVSSMDREAAEEISHLFHTLPYELDCSDSVPMRRPRFAWCSEALENTFPDIRVTQHAYWRRVHAEAAFPSFEQWVEPGWHWPGGEEGTLLPTCMKAISRDKPPPKPAGIRRCSEATLARWRADSFRYPPYQYSPEFLFWQESGWRLATSSERELLLGYGFEHTAVCLSAS